MQERLLTAEEVASILNISRSKAYSMMREKEIPTITIGKNVRVAYDDLEAYITTNTVYKGDENEYLS